MLWLLLDQSLSVLMLAHGQVIVEESSLDVISIQILILITLLLLLD